MEKCECGHARNKHMDDSLICVAGECDCDCFNLACAPAQPASGVREKFFKEACKVMQEVTDCEEFAPARANIVAAALEAAYQSGQESKWVSVKERLPEDCRTVGLLLGNDFTDPATGYYAASSKTWLWQGAELVIKSTLREGKVTHWCELKFPSLPLEENNG